MEHKDRNGWKDVFASQRTNIIGLLLVLTTLLVYAQVAQFDFVNYDDGEYVTGNPYVTGGLTFEGLAWAFTAFYESNWHPVTWLSHMLDVQLFGLDPGAHHLVNLLWHVLNTLLLFILLRNMTGSLWRSALVAALFALHPLHVESVAWIAERKDVLSTFFYLFSIFLYDRYVKHPSPARYLFVFGAMALGLMSKPMVVTLPFVLLLLDFWPLKRPEASSLRHGLSYDSMKRAWPLLREKLPLFILTALSCLVTFYAQERGGAMTVAALLDTGTRIGNALLAYMSYGVKTLLPVDLAVFYPYPDSMSFLLISLASVTLAAITFAVFKLRKDHAYLLVGWLWFVGTLIPVIGIVQVGGQAMADRYTYIPLIGLFIIVAWGMGEIMGRFPRIRTLAVTGIAIVIAVMMAATFAQIRHWKNSVTLFEHALAVTTDNPVSRNNLGQALALNGSWQKAVEQFRVALTFGHGQEVVQANLANALLNLEQTEEAIKHYRLALKMNPFSEKTHNSLGLAYEKQGNNEKALYHYETALRLKPDFGEALTNLGNLYYNAGDFENAVRRYRAVLRLNPFSVQTLSNLGLAFEKLGSRDWAIKHYRQAISLDPKFAPAHGNLGVALIRAGQLEEAIEHLQRAVDLDPNYRVARQNLEKALAIREAERED